MPTVADALTAIESLRQLIDERLPPLAPLREAPAIATIGGPLAQLIDAFAPPAHDEAAVVEQLRVLADPEAAPVVLDLGREMTRAELLALRDHYQRSARDLGLPLGFYLREASDRREEGRHPALMARYVVAEPVKR